MKNKNLVQPSVQTGALTLVLLVRFYRPQMVALLNKNGVTVKTTTTDQDVAVIMSNLLKISKTYNIDLNNFISSNPNVAHNLVGGIIQTQQYHNADGNTVGKSKILQGQYFRASGNKNTVKAQYFRATGDNFHGEKPQKNNFLNLAGEITPIDSNIDYTDPNLGTNTDIGGGTVNASTLDSSVGNIDTNSPSTTDNSSSSSFWSTSNLTNLLNSGIKTFNNYLGTTRDIQVAQAHSQVSTANPKTTTGGVGTGTGTKTTTTNTKTTSNFTTYIVYAIVGIAVIGGAYYFINKSKK